MSLLFPINIDEKLKNNLEIVDLSNIILICVYMEGIS
jgi:hypothetical protein